MPSKKPEPAGVLQFSILADELGALEKEMAPHAQKIARIDQLRKALRAACTAKAEDAWTINGKYFVAVLGPRANERVINFPALVKAITAKSFALFAKCSLKDLESNVPPAVMASVVSTEACGSRSLKTFERGAAAA